MGSKYIITFAVFAIVAQSSFAQVVSFYDISIAQSAVFNQLRENQNLTNTGRVQGYMPLFDLYEVLGIKLINGLEIEPQNITNIVNTSLSSLLYAFGVVGYSSALASGKICSAAEAYLEYAVYLTDVFVTFEGAILLATSGNYTENWAEIEELHLRATDDVGGMIKVIYDFLRSCLNTSESDILAAVKSSEDQNNVNVVRVVNAVYEGAKAILIANSAETKHVDLLSTIKHSRSEARVALTDIAVSEYTLFQALFLQSQLNLTGLATQLYSIQYTWLLWSDRYVEGTELIFNIITEVFNAFESGIWDYETVNSILADTIENLEQTSTYYKEGLEVLVESVLENDSTAEAVAASARKFFVTFSIRASKSYYGAVSATEADAPYSKILEEIEVRKEDELSGVPDLVGEIMKLIRNGKTWSDDVEAEILAVQDAVITLVSSYGTAIYGAIERLAKASFATDGVSADDFDAITNFQSDASSAIHNFTYAISNIRYIVLRADNEN